MPIPLVNPYFEVGNIHNQALDWIASQLHAPEVPDAPKVVELVTEWYVTQNPQVSPEQQVAFYALTANGINMAQRYSVEELCRLAQLSAQATDFIVQAAGVRGDFHEVLIQLQALNERALAADLPVNDQFYTLLMLAIAIKSAEYGLLQKELGDQSPWIAYGRKDWSWQQDAQGAVAGAIGGLIGGIPAGWGGVLLGGLLGAIGGGIGTSVADWLFGNP